MKDKNKIKEIAERIYNIIDPWDREFTVDELAEEIAADPMATIEGLLDRIEED